MIEGQKRRSATRLKEREHVTSWTRAVPSVPGVDAGDVSDGADGAEQIAAQRFDPDPVGAAVRRERSRAGMTLAELGAKTGLTISALSQIERGATDPSISALRRIARALDVPAFRLLIGRHPVDSVLRRGARPRLSFSGQSVPYELVALLAGGTIKILGLTLEPGLSTRPTPTRNGAETIAYVLRGRVLAEVGGETYDVGSRDSILINRGLAHRLVQPRPAGCRAHPRLQRTRALTTGSAANDGSSTTHHRVEGVDLGPCL